MSASDAAPLPRLGEVFFDVRGSSRSMRLSWYADTGVAVFSIWQGGVCTGTFRLPIDDLPRMVETLQRGPQGRRAARAPAGPAQADWDPYAAPTAYVPPGYAEPQDYPVGGYPQPDPVGGYEQPDPVGGYPQPDDSTGGYRGGPGAVRRANTDSSTDYGQERFVPPYVRDADDGFPFDNPAGETEYRSDYGQHAFRHGAPPVRSDTERYPEEQWSSAGYSDDPRYR
jgi:hypothetical protein